jgi:hypothetical protein
MGFARQVGTQALSFTTSSWKKVKPEDRAEALANLRERIEQFLERSRDNVDKGVTSFVDTIDAVRSSTFAATAFETIGEWANNRLRAVEARQQARGAEGLDSFS